MKKTIQFSVFGLVAIFLLTAASTPIKDLLLRSNMDAGGHRITNLATPTGTNDAATKGYVDSVAASGGVTNVFSTNSSGLVPPSGSALLAFLRGDGTWQTVTPGLTNAVTSLTAGDGLSGGTVTTSGTLAVDSSVVRTNDSRLTNARPASSAAWSVITGAPTTLSGYGITDAVPSSDSRLTNARALSGLLALSQIDTTGASSNQVIGYNGTSIAWLAQSGGSSTNSGTVTSITAGDGLSGGTITSAGTLAVDSSVVRTNDTRLTDARPPSAHTQGWSTITNTPTTVAGYGITDAGTVTSITASSPLTGGTITTSGTIGFDGTTSFVASGATSLNASALSSGTVDSARLPILPLTLLSTNSAATNKVVGFDGTNAAWVTQSASSANFVHGQCRLAYSATNQITLIRYGGPGFLQINGSAQQIPSGGVNLANTGLSASTLYYIYAYDNAGTMTLEASTTGHTTTNGVEIKSGDGTRTLVGMVYMDSGTPGAFADTASKRYVASFFNRRNRDFSGSAVPSSSTSSTNFVELNSGSKSSMITWADESTSVAVGGYVYNATQLTVTALGLGIDSTSASSIPLIQTACPTGSAYAPIGISGTCTTTLSEGFHYVTPLGFVTGSTGTYAVQHYGQIRQ